jgi:hypothetical protein
MYMNKFITITVIGLLMFVTQGYSQKKGTAPVWPGVSYRYVKVYVYNLDNQLHGRFQPVKSGKLDMTVVAPGVELTTQQTSELMAVFNSDTRVLNAGLSGCYEPHHAFVFYDEKDQIVASSDVCFLCQGIRFYPAKKYFKEINTYNDAATKLAEKQLNEIQKIVEKTEIPVFKKSMDYIKYSEGLTKNDTLTIENDSIFKSLIHSFKNIKSLLNQFPNSKTFKIDSTKRYVAGGDKVMFYFVKGDGVSVECSSYDGGQLWITSLKAEEKSIHLLHKIEIGDTKYEIFERLLPTIKAYPYEKTIQVYSKTETIIFGFDENHFINSINYNSLH